MVELLLNNHHLSLDVLITDRHRQIQKYVREELSNNPQARNLRHYFDVWHIAKGVFQINFITFEHIFFVIWARGVYS